MARGSLTSLVLDFSNKIKPFLIKVLPIGFLRNIKKIMVNSSMSKLNAEGVIPFSRSLYPDGINLIGYIRGEFGLGQSCRLVAAGLSESGIDFTIYNYEHVGAMRFNDISWDDKVTDTTPYNINIVHIHPYEIPLAFSRLNRKIRDGRYNIAFWLWELEHFPAQWENAISLFDEIWTPSEFASESIRKSTRKPVHTIPYALRAPDCGEYGRDFFGLPEDKFLFLCMYDCNSNIERKNPLAAIQAYKKAFSPNERKTGLVFKLNNAQEKDLKTIRGELLAYPDIYFITEVLEKAQANALIACADVYVTLHRSEGFGLVPAEAMLLGTPVIATNWSANTEFMDETSACLVDFKFITLEKDSGPFPAGNRWADPDAEQAAGFMRKLYEDETFRKGISDNSKKRIEEKLAPERAGKLMRERIKEIYREETGDFKDNGMGDE